MRLGMTGAAVIGLGILLPGCAGPNGLTFYGAAPDGLYPYQFPRVDPQEVAERAVEGAALGAGLGTALGATFSINPAIGAVVGAETGATLGAVVGAATTHPLPDYTPVTVPAKAVIPGFYDTWPPGYHPPPVGSETPPPHPD
jgi:hypothetical protein